MKMCEKCREEPAAVPDRNRMGRPIKRICKKCHAGRLRGDLSRVLALHKSGKKRVDL